MSLNNSEPAVGDVGRDTGAELQRPYTVTPANPSPPVSPPGPGAIPGLSYGRWLRRKETCHRVTSSRFYNSFSPPPTPR